MKRSPGSITLAEVEIALSRAGATLRLHGVGGECVATIVRGGDEFVFPAQSMTDAIDAAAELAGIRLTEAEAA